MNIIICSAFRKGNQIFLQKNFHFLGAFLPEKYFDFRKAIHPDDFAKQVHFNSYTFQNHTVYSHNRYERSVLWFTMKNQYTDDHSIDPQHEVKQYFGVIERVAKHIGVFIFYMLVFSAISLVSGGFKF